MNRSRRSARVTATTTTTPIIIFVMSSLLVSLSLGKQSYRSPLVVSALSFIVSPPRIRQTSSSSRSTTVSPSLEAGRRRNARSRRREAAVTTTTTTAGELEWERFDFSDSPKWDRRFSVQDEDLGKDDEEDDDNRRSHWSNESKDDDLLHVASNSDDRERVHERETAEDVALQEDFDRRHALWEQIDPALVKAATDVLSPWVQPERLERIRSVLDQRTQQTRFLFENPANPSNVWACLRTLDSFGVQHVDVVVQSGRYKGKAALSQKRGMRTAMGSAKWLTLKNHLTTESALEAMKREGYYVMCTDVDPSSKDIRKVDWDASGKKICIVMGNEQDGISQAVKDLADESFYLPMVGFAESFNLSVATAITCAHLSAASVRPQEKVDENDKDGAVIDEREVVKRGPLRPGDLSEKEYGTLFLKGCLNSISHKTAVALLRKNQLTFPKDLNLS